MREKILELYSLLFGSFESKMANITLDGMEDIPEADLPPVAKDTIAFLRTTLTATRAEHDEGVVAVFERHLTEAEVDALLAYQKTAEAQKLREVTPQLFNELQDTWGNWKNATLEAHIDEFHKVIGFQEPAPAAPEAEVPVETVA